jgi:hypothetical protein
MPYAIDGTTIYLRQEAETNIAVRDEIVSLVMRSVSDEPSSGDAVGVEEAKESTNGIEPPGTGVQVMETEERKGTLYHSMRDLRNGNVVRNVTRSSARKLWRYAITEHESNPVKEDQVRWHGNLGVWKSSKRAGKLRFDLVQRMPDGQLHVYYGVTEDGIDGAWRVIAEENAS